MRESKIEQYLRTQVEAHGGRAYKWVSPGNAGVPDRLVFLKGVIFIIETKSTTGRLRAAQIVQRRQLEKLGFDVVILNSKEKVKLWVELQASILDRMALPDDQSWQEGRTGFEGLQ